MGYKRGARSNRKERIKTLTIEEYTHFNQITNVVVSAVIYNANPASFSAEIEVGVYTTSRRKFFFYKANNISSVKRVLNRIKRLNISNVSYDTKYYELIKYLK